MNIENIQQEYNYHKFIQNFLSLFKKIKEDENLPPLFNEIKKEDESIYNAVVGFNTVKFLIEHLNWDEDEDKNKAYEVIFPEWNKITKAKQDLEDRAQEMLSKHIDGGVEKVSIYGNHVSITLADNKKEFKISEFLNSDFCQKNEISGFSTLHSDGKSGMHGFVAEEEGRKIRHYVVTDGSYEMTLNWYVNGEKCTIKIKIDSEGVEFVEGNIDKGSKKLLEANKDVKIGGLFLHQIQFREKGQEKEVQHNKDNNKPSFETATRIDDKNITKDVKKPAQKHQATHMNQEVGSQTPPLPPLRTSSLPPEKDVFNEQGKTKSVSQKPNDLHRNEQTSNDQQKGEHQLTTVSSGNDPSSDPSDVTKSVSHNQDNRQEDEHYDNPTFTTFGHTLPGSQRPGDLSIKSTPSSTSSDNGSRPISLISTDRNDEVWYDALEELPEQELDEDKYFDAVEDLNEQETNHLTHSADQVMGEQEVKHNSNKPLSLVSTKGSKDVGQSKDTQSQKSSRRNGQESAEEERNFQTISKALESWIKKKEA